MKKSNSKVINFDHIVIGSGLAGLSSALHLARSGRKVALITKREIDDCNSKLAQGGVACVMDALDSFDEHVKDTLYAGAGLCNEQAVRHIVERGPAAIREMSRTYAPMQFRPLPSPCITRSIAIW